MAKYKIIVEYDGTDFVGWQKQENGPSIQSSLEDAIKKITSGSTKAPIGKMNIRRPSALILTSATRLSIP